MDPRRRRILGWICTGKHVFEADYVKPTRAASSHSPSPRILDGCAAGSAGDVEDASSATTTSSSPLPDRLVGADDDLLIPTAAAIHRVFRDGRATWTRFVKLADSLPPRLFPAGFGDPAIMLKDVPALPASLPSQGCLVGRPLWRIPDPEQPSSKRGDEKLDLQYSHGIRKFLPLSYPSPVECRVYSHPPLPGHGLLYAQRGLAVLTMCWSYILSIRLLELQGRRPVYSRDSSLLPVSAKAFRAMPGKVPLYLGASASRQLVRWLCAVLAPKPGWSADTGGFPPWAAFCSHEARFVVVTADGPTTFSSSEPPPNSAEATELLIELCRLSGFLEPEHQPSDAHSELSPATAAFFATLALPFYRHDDLQPQFPVLLLRRRSDDSSSTTTTDKAAAESARIRQYTGDLRYYMTLSMDPRSLGSTLWSVFWQPDIETNLVSPWLSSVLHVIKPLLESRKLAQLTNVFAFRRPRVASWWLGVFLLGDLTILGRISRYLETLMERWGFGTGSHPDIAIAAWTGSPQSFLDDRSPRPYKDPKEPIARADLLRHRYNFFLQDEMSVTLSWRPFGHVPKELVEPELWPWLERGHVREYVHWVWWIKKGKQLLSDIQLGFRRDTGKFVEDVPDRLGTTRGRGRISADEVIKLEPSMQSTLRMVADCMMEVSGDQDTCILAVPGAVTHPWLKGWRGLE